MEKKLKELYEAPSTLVFEVAQEGVLCASPDFKMPFNAEEDWS